MVLHGAEYVQTLPVPCSTAQAAGTPTPLQKMEAMPARLVLNPPNILFKMPLEFIVTFMLIQLSNDNGLIFVHTKFKYVPNLGHNASINHKVMDTKRIQ